MSLLAMFPSFVPHSAGSNTQREAITYRAIHRTLPELALLARSVGWVVVPRPCNEFPQTPGDRKHAEILATTFELQGSDKAWHEYHNFYGTILGDRAARVVVEIGIGTNYEDVVSNMGAGGRPGASLRSWRDFLPNARIIGADIDRRVLFQEDRIETHYVNQDSDQSLQEFAALVPDACDLVIDDGLHSPLANLPTLRRLLPKVKSGGWFVVEDVQCTSLDVWQAVSAFLPHQYRCHLLQARGGLLFAVQVI